eukprot:NODE_310_length_11257_cov_0.344417.p7 type:complete len:133 gc:universal NODE_310_length_11257_cov_0.344417:9461-9859(+)
MFEVSFNLVFPSDSNCTCFMEFNSAVISLNVDSLDFSSSFSSLHLANSPFSNDSNWSRNALLDLLNFSFSNCNPTTSCDACAFKPEDEGSAIPLFSEAFNKSAFSTSSLANLDSISELRSLSFNNWFSFDFI